MVNIRMEKFGLEYFAKRGQIINEMAKPNEFGKLGKENPAYLTFNSKVYLPLIKAMTTVGNIGDKSKAAQKAIMYLTTILLGNKIGNHSGAYRDFVNSFIKKNQDGYVAWLGSKGDNSFQQTQYVLIQTVKKNLNKINDPEVIQQIFNPENIKSYAETNRISDVSNFSRGRARETENVFDMSYDKLDELKSQVAPIIKKLNVAQGGIGRTLKKNVTSDPNSPVEVAKTLKSAVEDLLDSKRDVVARMQQGSKPTDDESIILSKFPEQEITKLIGTFQRLIDTGKGINIDDVYAKIIQPFQNHQNQIVAGFGDLLELSVDSLMDTTEQSVASDFGPYSNELVYTLLDKGLITDDEIQLLKQWIPIAKKQKELKQMKSDTKSIGSAADQYLQKPEKEESEERMSYMSEQVASDALLKPLGYFQDRGYKKFRNYAQWENHNKVFSE